MPAYLEPDYVLENNCQVLDPASAIDGDGRFVEVATNVRRNLKKAKASLFIDEDQTETNVETRYEIHEGRHRQIGATPLPKAMFEGALVEMIPRDRGRFFFMRRSDAPAVMVAGGFYVYHGNVIDALMPSVRTDSLLPSPNFIEPRSRESSR